jgi:hypothetical protein
MRIADPQKASPNGASHRKEGIKPKKKKTARKDIEETAHSDEDQDRRIGEKEMRH